MEDDMKRQTSNHRQPGYTLTSTISVLMSLSIFLSVASVGWETLETGGANSLFISKLV
jgi:hypothetical protein